MTRHVPASPDDAWEAAAHWCVQLSDGPLPDHDWDRFQQWLGSDPDHQDLFERTVAAWTAIEHQASQPELLRMRGEALESMHDAGRARWKRRRLKWRGISSIAACLVLIMVGVFAWQQMPTTYSTGVGERRVVELEDGSTVSMDAATQLKVRYLGDRREVWLLNGRAKFSVAKEPLRIFSVQVGERKVVATGTQFSVEKIANDVRVILYEGHVAVMDTSFEKPRPLLIGSDLRTIEQALEPGSELIAKNAFPPPAPYFKSAQKSPKPGPYIVPIDPRKSLSWEAGLLEFTDEALPDAVERMNRYGTVQLNADTITDRSILISGRFKGGDTEAFVEGVTSLFPVRAIRKPDGNIKLREARP